MSYRDEASLSPTQRAVLFDGASRVLVAAGAGSGKTKLLVAYFVHALLEDGMSLDELAAVTFTRKAGFELAERIRKELVECGRPDLARAVDGAAIGTIHGLCRRLLADQSLEAGVDPSFGVLEADGEKLAKEEVSKVAWGRVIEAAPEAELALLAGRGDRFRELALSLYGRLRGLGQEAPQVHIEPGPSEAAARAGLLEACHQALAAGRSLSKRSAWLEKDLGNIVSCIQWLEHPAAGPGGERTVAAAGRFFPSRRTSDAEPFLVPVRAALAGYRCALAEEELRPLLAVTNRLLAVFHEEYRTFKERRGVLDFADLELRARAVLSEGAAAGFRRLLVDEFQDTNELQCAIIEGLGAGRLLMVGDERQSIYRFRGADVEVFRRREEAKDLSQHRLDTNYRSRPEILSFINHLFSRDAFFGTERFKPLVAGRDLPAEGPNAEDRVPWHTEVLVVERTLEATAGDDGMVVTVDARQAEAHAVAERMRRLVLEEGKTQGDIVLLLPALSDVNLYQEALLAAGLDVYLVRGKGYYSQDEVADVTALLQLLVNPHDDLALLTVLRSPMVGVSDDCLYLLGRSRNRDTPSLWEVVREGRVSRLDAADLDRLEILTRRLEGLRSRVGRPGLSRLIDEAVAVCDYDLCLLSSAEGKRRFANIRKLMRMAADFEALEGPDLAGFVSLLSSLGELGDDEGNAASLAEGEDVVRIMTVHQAKGLEFPVVVLAGLCSDPWDPPSDELVVGSDGRVAAIVKGVKADQSETCLPHWGPALEIMAENRTRLAEEDVRLLYVAMTRARDRLILVGARRAADKPEARRIGRVITALGLASPPAPDEVVVLDQIHAAVIGVAPPSLEGGEGAAEAGQVTVCATDGVAEPPCFLALPAPSVASRHLSFSALAAYSRCPRQFYLDRVLRLAAADGSGLRTVETELEEDHTGGPGAREEALLDTNERIGGRDVGVLVHALLERADLAGDRPACGILCASGEGIAAEIGLDLSAGAIQRAAELTVAFWDSPLAGNSELAMASREVPFSFVHGEVTIQGVMDLLCRSGDRWLVVDYKSNALDGQTPDEVVNKGYALQAAVYGLAALKAGAPRVCMQFLFLERPQQPVVLEYLPDDRERLEAQLVDALVGLEENLFPACPGSACGDCLVEDLCRAMDHRRLVVE